MSVIIYGQVHAKRGKGLLGYKFFSVTLHIGGVFNTRERRGIRKRFDVTEAEATCCYLGNIWFGETLD